MFTMELTQKELIAVWTSTEKYYQTIDKLVQSGKFEYHLRAWKHLESQLTKFFGKPKYKDWRSYHNARNRYNRQHGLRWPAQKGFENLPTWK
jgi:hypothetical protein